MVRRRSRQAKLPRARPVQIMSGVSVWRNYGTTVTDCGRWLARPCRENHKQNRAIRRETEARWARVGVDDGDVRLMCRRVSWGKWRGGSSTPEGRGSSIGIAGERCVWQKARWRCELLHRSGSWAELPLGDNLTQPQASATPIAWIS